MRAQSCCLVLPAARNIWIGVTHSSACSSASQSDHLIRLSEAMVNFVELDSTSSVLVLLASHGGRLLDCNELRFADIPVYLVVQRLATRGCGPSVELAVRAVGPGAAHCSETSELLPRCATYLSVFSIAVNTHRAAGQHCNVPAENQLHSKKKISLRRCNSCSANNSDQQVAVVRRLVA